MRILYYGKRDTTFSDHRPVLCLYKFTVRQVDKQKYQDCMKLILMNKQQSRRGKVQQVSLLQSDGPKMGPDDIIVPQ